MAIDTKKILSDLLQNEKILEVVKKAGLTPLQTLDALPILIDLQEELNNAGKITTTIYTTPSGGVKRGSELSINGQGVYSAQIVTSWIQRVNFDEEKKYFRDSSRKELLEALVKILEKGKGSRGIFLYGQMGIGKTFTFKRFAKKIALKGSEVGIINLPSLVSMIKSSFSNGGRYSEIFSTLSNVDYLFLDDIGGESISTWFRDGFLFNLLNDRMEKQKTTFFTSQYSFVELEKVQSRTVNQKFRDQDRAARLLDRIKALTTEFHLLGKNRRY